MDFPKYRVMKVQMYPEPGKLIAEWEGDLIDIIEGVYNEMIDRQIYESFWVKADGSEENTDVGYACDGARLFLEELKEKLK